MKKIGFLGLGIMGNAMVMHLVRGGFEVTVWNRTGERCQVAVEAGARQGGSPAEVVAESDVTFAMVSDPDAALSLCFDKDGVLEGMAPGKGYIDVSTVDPNCACRIAEAVRGVGGRYLEAPVSGSKKPAEDGNLVFLCGGDESLFQEAGLALDLMGKKSFYLGEAGRGARMKLVVNMIMGTMMSGFAEGLSLGEKLDLEMTDILEVLTQGAIDNPMFRLKGPQMAAGSFSTAFPLKHMQKDMRLALQLGDECGQPLFTATSANNLYIKARAEGEAESDFSAVLKIVAGEPGS